MSASSGLSAVMEARILSWLSGTAFATAPTNLFVALFGIAPTDGGATVAGTETDYAGYARVSVAAATLFSVAPAGIPKSITSQASVTFPIATGNSTLQVTGWGVYDASTAGNLLVYGTIATPFQVLTSNTPTFAAGALIGSVQ